MREEWAPPYASAELAPAAGRTRLRKKAQRPKGSATLPAQQKGAGLPLGAIEFQKEETI
jgi:hypothetical protein